MFKIYFLSNYVLTLHKQEAILQKPWSSLQIHKKSTPVEQRNFGAMWWEGQKNQECHSRSRQLSAYVQPTSPNSRAQSQKDKSKSQSRAEEGKATELAMPGIS